MRLFTQFKKYAISALLSISVMVGAIAPAFTITANAYEPTEANVEDICAYAYEQAVASGFDGEASELGIFGFCYNEADPMYSNAGWIYAIDLRQSPEAYIHYVGTRQAQVVFGTTNGVYYVAQVGDLLNYNGLTFQNVENPSIGFNRVDYDTNFLFTNMLVDTDSHSGLIAISNNPSLPIGIEKSSNMAMLSELYDISFIPKKMYNVDTETYVDFNSEDFEGFKGMLMDTMDDTGYNLISVQFPDMYTIETWGNYPVYGDIIFTPSSKYTDYTLKDFTMSVGSDNPLGEYDVSPYPFGMTYDSSSITNVSELTVNSSRFIYANTIVIKRNWPLVGYNIDVADTDGSLPTIIFKGVGSINAGSDNSIGSFVYNFSYSDILDENGNSLTSADIDDMEKSGKDKNDKTRSEAVYDPILINYSHTSAEFEYDGNFNYDWSPYEDLFDIFFQDFIVQAMLIMLGVALVSYILFGKR